MCNRIDSILDMTERYNLLLLDGPNFSGRTDIMRTVVNTNRSCGINAVYVGPEVYNSVSGLTTSVFDEIRLHAGGDLAYEELDNLAAHLGLLELGEQNPFTLSGGEQACLVTVSTMALQPRRIAIDCALEQLDPSLKLMLLAWLSSQNNHEGLSTIVADNRMSESYGAIDAARVHCLPQVGGGDQALASMLRIDPILPSIDFDFQIEPCEISLNKLNFSYIKNKPILNNISITLTPGRIYTLSGCNGAGKTTLAKLLSGVIKPDSGQILRNNIEFQPWESPGRLFSYHFQNPDLQLFATTVAEEILSGLVWQSLPPGEIDRRIQIIATAFGLTGLMAEHPLDLPFVLRKRVALAATLVMGAPWFILDEPTLGQDDQSAFAIATQIRKLAASGIGIIIISHSPWFTSLFDATSIYLRHGCLTLE